VCYNRDFARIILRRVNSSTFYGYANADILFDSNLLRTLSDIRPHLSRLRRHNRRGLLITGVRSDCTVDARSPGLNRCGSNSSLPSDRHAMFASSAEVNHDLPGVDASFKANTGSRHTFSPEKSTSIRDRSGSGLGNSSGVTCRNLTSDCSLNSTSNSPKDHQRRSRLILTSAQDYFITVQSGLPWDSMPDMVVGRAGIDNWLLVTALVGDAVVVDAGRTVTARHQVPPGYRPSAHYDRRPGSSDIDDARLNYRLAGKSFDYSLGLTDCAPFYTMFNRKAYDSSFQFPMTSSNAVTDTSSDTHSAKLVALNENISHVDRDNGDDSTSSVVLSRRQLNRYCKRALVKRGQNPRKFMLRNQLR